MLRMGRSYFVWIISGVAVLLASALCVNAYAAPAAQACTNDAEIVEASSDPPELALAPGQSFSVSWRIRNTGDCRWTTGYSVNLADGSHMGGEYYTSLSRRISPNATYLLTLDLLAPTIPGNYHTEWELMDADYAPFGPRLALDVEVSDLAAEPELPDVLLLAGLGMGGEGCWEAVPEGDGPSLQLIEYGRVVDICLYSLPTGELVHFTLTSPTGETFTTARIVDPPMERFDADGNSLGDHTLVSLAASWLDPAPGGTWTLTAEANDTTLAQTVEIPEPGTDPNAELSDGPRLTHAPAAAVDPFRAAAFCNYDYFPGDQVIIQGADFPATRDLHFGIYGQRDDGETTMFLVRTYTDTVATDDEGAFSLTYAIPAATRPGDYWVVATDDIAGAFTDDDDGDGFVEAFDVAGTVCFGVRFPAMSPIAALQLAYVDGAQGNRDLHILDLDSGVSRDLAIEECDEAAPAWWPDGFSVVYQSDCRGSYDIYRRDSWGDSSRRLTTSSSYDEGEPAVSPDGSTLLFRRTPTGEFEDEDGELVLRNLDRRAVTPLGIAGRAPAWSPDGTQIAYMARPDGEWQVYIYDVDRDESRLFSEDCPTQCGYPAWSPDGESLAYSVSRPGRRFVPDAIWIAPVAGGAAQVWQEEGAGAPAWSLGRVLAFTTDEGIAMAPDPSQTDQTDVAPQLLLEQDDVREPAWSR